MNELVKNPPSRAARFGPWIVVLLAVIYLARAAAPQAEPGPFEIDALSKVPVSFGGRVLPIDSVARNALMGVSGKQSLSAGSPISTGQQLAPPFLSPKHEVNWPLLLSRFLAEKDQEAASISKHLWSLMNEEQRKTLTDAAARGVLASDEPALLDAFNELLMHPGFYNAALWQGIELSAEVRHDMERVLGDARDPHIAMADRVRLNRRLLAAAYGDLVSASRDKPMPAIRWLLDVIAKPQFAEHYEVFRIDDPDVLAIFGWKAEQKKYFSLHEIQQRGADFPRQFNLARQVDANSRDRFQKHVLNLAGAINSVNLLAELSTLHLTPPVQAGQDWMTLQAAFQHRSTTGVAPPGFDAWAGILDAYHKNRPGDFNRALADYRGQLSTLQPKALDKAGFETFFNRFSPFTKGIFFYLVIMLLVCFSWLRWRGPLLSTAFKLLILVLVLHSAALVARVYLSGRPPVTNLYSSAVFIGWGVVLLCIVLERLHKNGLGTMVAAVAGFITLIIAHNLGKDGDTMAVLQAVLDTNFWLATHVIIITLGYSATFLAGLLGIAYILRGMFTTTLSKQEGKSIGQMIYGIICFALLFSFVGTILGGIWADQSWGRFWGWDPKENGALLIVLWNALILHARWGGIAKERGMAALAVFGNIVTSWSWFGTNMLGVGLHAYGFIDSAVFWMFVFVASQLGVIAIGCLPLTMWRSFKAPAAVVHVKHERPGKRAVGAPIVTART